MTSNTLFVFTKPNRMGTSKTRLAKDIGFAEAQRINAMSTARVMRAVTDPRWQTFLMVAPDMAVHETSPLWPSNIPRLPQGRGSLGERMTRAFYRAPPGRVAFTGTDMPDLTRNHIGEAFRRLTVQDAVFGPAEDGGFWLYAQRKRTNTHPPFENVRWSGAFALADVRRNLGEAVIGFLPEKTDLDDLAALRTWQSQRRRVCP